VLAVMPVHGHDRLKEVALFGLYASVNQG